jgi:chemotaxis protein MotB
MGAQVNASPVIIKRKKVIKGGGHHGGAWKVAYADFVTAMMAFFMLMWLLNATTEQQRKGISDYFSPTIPINRISGGGDGAFGGDSIFSEDVLARNGTGATKDRPTESNAARGETGEEDALEALESELLGRGGESELMDNMLEHITTRITDEGLVIEIFESEDFVLFEDRSAEPTQLMRDIAAIFAQSAKTVVNPIAVGAHVRAKPIVLAKSPAWELSTERANRTRMLLERSGITRKRVQRVTGHADMTPISRNPMALRNSRIEMIFLRDVN